jgi:hypothetical protein
MSEIIINTYEVKLAAGKTETISARGQKFLLISSLSDDNAFQSVDVSITPDRRFVTLPLGLSVALPKDANGNGMFYDRVILRNSNGVAITVKFIATTLNVDDTRLIFNQQNPLPVTLAATLADLTIAELPPVYFDEPQPVKQATGCNYAGDPIVSIGAGNDASFLNFTDAVSGYLVQIFDAGKTCTVSTLSSAGGGAGTGGKNIMRISDADGAVFIPISGGLNFHNDDPDNALNISITQLRN